LQVSSYFQYENKNLPLKQWHMNRDLGQFWGVLYVVLAEYREIIVGMLLHLHKKGPPIFPAYN